MPIEEFKRLQFDHQKLLEDSVNDKELHALRAEHTRECEQLRREIDVLKKELANVQETASKNYVDVSVCMCVCVCVYVCVFVCVRMCMCVCVWPASPDHA